MKRKEFDIKLSEIRKHAKSQGMSFKRVGKRDEVTGQALWMFTNYFGHNVIAGPMPFHKAYDMYKNGKI